MKTKPTLSWRTFAIWHTCVAAPLSFAVCMFAPAAFAYWIVGYAVGFTIAYAAHSKLSQ